MPRFVLHLALAGAALCLPELLPLGVHLALGVLLAAGLALLLLVLRQARRLRSLRAELGHARGETLRLLELAQRIDVLADSCDIALQQQQLKLECSVVAFSRIKVRGQRLAGNAQQVGNESRQSLRLARKGQAGLSASLMAFRSMDQSVRAAACGDMAVQEVRALARESRDQTYGANLALAGISEAASSISERGTLIARDCEAQERLADEIGDALASIGQLAHTSAWRSRQARAASLELGRRVVQLETRLKAFPWPQGLQGQGVPHDGVQDPDPPLPRIDEVRCPTS